MPRINCRINESNPANAIVKGAQLRCPLEILNPVKSFPTHASPLNAKILQCFSQLYGLFPLDLGVSCKQQPDGRHITINLLGVVKHCKSFSFSVSPFVINSELSFFRSIEYRRPHRGILKEQLLDIHYEVVTKIMDPSGNASVVNHHCTRVQRPQAPGLIDGCCHNFTYIASWPRKNSLMKVLYSQIILVHPLEVHEMFNLQSMQASADGAYEYNGTIIMRNNQELIPQIAVKHDVVFGIDSDLRRFYRRLRYRNRYFRA
ncbi:hypothetical protein B0H19DRAFT_1082288 [Mycena capillaripes]|nr:hypothetical protein B0H19DRAFT_1082288 [Mycena capillaripes]